MTKAIWQNESVIVHSEILARSYLHWTGKFLFPHLNDRNLLADAMYHAPFIVVSHGTEKDPIFNYANLAAQKLWKISWKDFTAMPSRLSAEPVEDKRRNELLDEGKKRGITYLEKGIRITKDKKRFYIKNVILFNLLNENKIYSGQGAVYEQWEFID